MPKILIVNDDAASLLALSSILNHWARENDCEILTARSGKEALRQVLTNDFAVILLDVKMPEMDGFETAEAIHLRSRSSAIPIIFVTAYLSDDINRLKAYQQGAADYLFTPVIPQVLVAKVSAFVALMKKNLELERQTARLGAINLRLQLEMAERKIAVQQNRNKDEFLAMLGHELRNPLNAITSAAALMSMPSASEQAIARAKQIVTRQSAHLTHIVDDLLDLGRVLAQKILLNPVPMDLADALAGCVETVRAGERAHAHRLVVESETVWVEADPTRIEQVFTNLIDNALKYTPAGGEVRIKLAREGGDAVVTVRDTGIGIHADLLPSIFEVFVQGQDTLDRAQGGLGIGLALAQQLVLLHGGSIDACSAGVGKGSCFTVRIPASQAACADAAAVQAPAGGQRKIVLIDDNRDCLDVMSELLQAYGHEVAAAPDGPSGLALAGNAGTEVVLIDIGLPGMNGYEVAAALRASAATAHLRLIALTGYGQDDDRRRTREAGFDLHLVKPVPTDILLNALGEAVAKAS